MPRAINPIRKALVKRALMQGKPISTALKEAGYAKGQQRGHNNSTSNKVVRSCFKEIQEAFGEEQIIKELKEILQLKLQLEKEIFKDAQKIKNRKLRLQVINKTKDSITEISKTLRLYEGQSTEKIEVEDKQARIAKLRDRLLLQN